MLNSGFARFFLSISVVSLVAGPVACSSVEEPGGSATAEAGYDMGNGIASYYGPGFHGGETAYQETFNQWHYTAAMRPTSMRNKRICVTNRNNSRQVEVRINDRGPWGTGAIIDLSTAAMQAVGGMSSGRIPVHLYVLGSGESCGHRGPSPEEIAKLCARKFDQRIEGTGRDAVLRVTTDIACPSTKVVVTFSGQGKEAKTFEGVVKESSAAGTITARFRLAALLEAGYTSATIALGKNKTVHYKFKDSVSLPRSEPVQGQTDPEQTEQGRDQGHVQPRPLPPLPPPPLPPLPAQDDAAGPVRMETPNGVVSFPPLKAPPPVGP